ncbi:MAG TPA: S9 family peptidase [bacterium]|nr:S9 family peptidase [bacterium]HPN44246.1 S9 family peptidase [bacterium]
MKKTVMLLMLLGACACVTAAEKRAQTVEDMWAMQRIKDLQVSPDGKQIVFSVTAYNMEANKGQTDLWLVPASGGEAMQLTNASGNNTAPRWLPDGSALVFLSDRGEVQQLYKMSPSGGDAQQLTHLPVDIESFVLSPQGNKFAFTATVYADAKTLQESAERDRVRKDSKVQARIIDHLFYRYWNEWREGKRTHVFVAALDGSGVVDLTPGEYDAPPLDLGGAQDFVFSPDGSELAFVSNHDAVPATSTNNDIFIVPVTGGEALCVTKESKAVDNSPAWSPDGKYFAYKAMQRPGFESDQYDLILLDRKSGTRKSLTEAFDRSVDEWQWSPDSKSILFNAEDQGRKKIYVLEIISGNIKELVSEHTNAGLRFAPDGKSIYFKQQSVTQPDEIFTADLKGNFKQVTFINRVLLEQLALNPVEDIWYPSFDRQKVHCMLVKPPFFNESEKYPLVLLIHGGPENMFGDDYHYRWNAPMFAAPGYVVAMINIRGSQGYGQDWCDLVAKDWGGGPYKDLMAGVDYLLATVPYIDKNRIAAAGASYGGYMVNWIATHTDRFKVLVSHSGVFDLRSKYGATEELWFPEWEFNGAPWDDPDMYAKWSPSFYVNNMKQFKTPTLVIHGQNDFRVSVTQSMQLFTALQKMDVPSRFIYFPDEYHFVTKPQNARLWWNEVFAWIDKWINK